MRGFVTASANYRLGHDFSEYGQYKARYRAIQDGNAALRFLVQNANAARIDTNWVFVGGQSAGSLLALGMIYADQAELDSIALLYSATPASAELGGLHTSGYALTNTCSIKGIFNNWGGVSANEMDAGEMLPTIAFHGTMDTVVRIGADTSFAQYTLNGSQAIHNTLIANNICSELTVEVTNAHGIYRNAASQFRAQRASCFFKSVFCSSCASVYTTDSLPANCSALPNASEPEGKATIRLYPNPFHDSFTVEGLEGALAVTISTCFGQVVYQGETLTPHLRVGLAPGLYFVQIAHPASHQTYTFKLVKE
jgi:predicted esterase